MKPAITFNLFGFDFIRGGRQHDDIFSFWLMHLEDWESNWDAALLGVSRRNGVWSIDLCWVKVI